MKICPTRTIITLCLIPGVILLSPHGRAQLLSEPSAPPPYWIEEIAGASDSETITSLVFKTTPGVEYSVQTSTNLTDWQTLDDRYYGLGQEVVIPMVGQQTTATGGGSGGGEPPPAGPSPVNVSILMQQATGGGIVISWISLDTGTASQYYLLHDNATTEWGSMPFYWNTFGNHNFTIFCTGSERTPPAANPLLAPADQTMVLALQENLPTMNAEVIANVIRARNTVHAPTSAGNSKFWRVVPNYSLDSDGDQTPDWLEFASISAGSSGAPGAAYADAFSADSNGNGVPDGEERDSDGDGVPDKSDASQSDKLINWAKNGAMRFAWFDVQLPAEGDTTPWQVNDQGKVLFEKKVWHNGTLETIATSGTNLSYCSPIALGDSGKMIGVGHIDPPEDSSDTTFNCMVMWANATVAPTVLNQGDIYPDATYYSRYNVIPDMALNENDEFVGVVQNKKKSDDEVPLYSIEHIEGNPRKVWKIDPTQPGSSGNLVEKGAAPNYASWVDKNEKFWGYDTNSKFSTSLGTGSPSQFEGPFTRSVELPTGQFAIFKGYNSPNPLAYEINDPPLPQFRTDDQWQALSKNSLLSRAVDFSTEGRFAICRSFFIWHNGLSDPVSEWSPGLPDDWKTPTENFLLDTTRHGWTLAVHSNGENPPKPAKAMIGLPLFLATPTPSEGLDAVSFTVNKSFNADLTGIQHEFWIMVPAGGSMTARLQSGACEATPLSLGGATGSKVAASPSSINSPDTPVTFSAPAEAAGTEEAVQIKLTDQPSLSIPLRAKIMEPRVVKVSVWPIRDPSTDAELTLPSETELEEYLNGIYKKQINVTFEVTNQPSSHSPLSTSERFRVSDSVSATQQKTMTNRKVGDIQIYAMGGQTIFLSEDPQQFVAVGYTSPADACVWMPVDRDTGGNNEQSKVWLNTAAHEIGHVLFGSGHPNIPIQNKSGPAPLPGTDLMARIMHNGFGHVGSALIRRVCVKAEWDKAEDWLKKLDTPQP